MAKANRWTAGLCVLVALAALAVYMGALRADFIVGYDDSTYVLANEQVKRGLTAEGVVWALTTLHAANWHPLTWLSHMVDVSLFALAPWGHHLTSVLLHALSAALLAWVLTRATGRAGRSVVVAGLFALHPLHVESVAWIAERKDVLSGLFFVLTLAAYIAWVRTPRAARYALVVVLFALGLMAKPMLVTLPLVLLLLDFWPLGRVAAPGAKAWRRLVVEKIPLFVLSAASSVVTLLAQRRGGTIATAADLPFADRLANAAVSYVKYVVLTVWPVGLSPYYPYVEARPFWQIVLAFAAMAAVIAVALVLWRSRPHLFTGWLWYVVMLVPVIGFVQVGAQAAADRYTYLPSIGLYLAVVWTGAEALGRVRGATLKRALAVAAAVVVLAAFGAATIAQVRHWKNAETLWRRAVEVTENNVLAQLNLAVELDRQGRLDEAIGSYSAAARSGPDDLDARSGFAGALARAGRLDEARRELDDVLRRNPRHTDAVFNAGFVALQQGRLDDAIGWFYAAQSLAPDRAEARQNLVVALSRRGRELGAQGQHEQAAQRFEKILEIDPGNVAAMIDLGVSRSKEGRYDDARRWYETAVKADPQSALAHANLAAVLLRLGRPAEAAQHIEQCRALGGTPPPGLEEAIAKAASR